MRKTPCRCGACPKCARSAYMRAWREKNPDKARAINQSYYARHGATWKKDPVKTKAQHLVYTEVRAGRLVPQGCELCGRKADAHHDDYAKPLEVRWFCRAHHSRLHAGIIQVGGG